MFGSVNNIHYLCMDNVREMSGWGNNTSWSVDSNLLYKIYKGPPYFSLNTFDCIKCSFYICIMKTILLINLIIGYVTLFGVLLIGVSLMTLTYFPTSKLSSFIRRHLITDEDLEPKN